MSLASQDIPALLEVIRVALFTGQISAAKVDAQRALVLLENRLAIIERMGRATPPAETPDLGRVCHECGAHWMTDAQLDKLDDAIKPWRDRALAAEGKLADPLKETEP